MFCTHTRGAMRCIRNEIISYTRVFICVLPVCLRAVAYAIDLDSCRLTAVYRTRILYRVTILLYGSVKNILLIITTPDPGGQRQQVRLGT